MSRIRVHVYLGTICQTEVFNQKLTFEENVDNIFSSFLIPVESRQNYILKLFHGGIVNSNNVLQPDDRLTILPNDKKEIKQETGQDITHAGHIDVDNHMLNSINNNYKDFTKFFNIQKNEEVPNEELLVNKKTHQPVDPIKYKEMLRRNFKLEPKKEET